MKKRYSKAIFLIIGFFAAVSLPSPIFGDNPSDSLTPMERHRIMGQAKAERLSKLRTALAVQPPFLANQIQFDVTYYRIILRVDIPGEMLHGDVMIVAQSLIDDLDTVQIDFDSTMAVDSIITEGGSLNYTVSRYGITIALDKSYPRNLPFSFWIHYHGHPASGGFQGFAFDTRNGFPVVSSLSEPYLAHTWWPCKDRPDDKADSLDIFITCDTAFFCASNGQLVDTSRNGDGTWTFNYQVRYPITTYLFSVAISNYTVWKDWYHYGSSDSMVIINHVYPDQDTYSRTHWNITPYAIGVFAGLFGQYPFLTEKYGHANFEWAGGMEHQTVTSMTGTSFGFSEPVVIHELSHQWWGDMITCNNWHDIWLNEGFASYSEALYYEVKQGEAFYHTYMAGMNFTGGGTIYIYDTTNVWNIFGNIVYDKAAWMLHMLRHIVGDSTFFDILHTYYNSPYKYRDITSDQFINLCETVSGKELDYFFNEWLYGTYRPSYIWSYMSELDLSDNKYWTYFLIEQGQTTPPLVFSMPLDIRFTS
ncbi:MAG: M1 family metallopeptidase, partial [candidate division Zixibacteria bacterium]|nr:M1 family metallopeptidase [candidate division Zixibacteria bacterium]